MKLRHASILILIITGLILYFSYLWNLPDGTLRITHCAVGQGDAAYIQFPNGHDMVVDGGPNNKILECLNRVMPPWDREISMVLMTHPQKDHMYGLVEVLKRYHVQHFLRSNVDNTTEGYTELRTALSSSGAQVREMVSGDVISIGDVQMRILWPTQSQIAKAHPTNTTQVLGASVGDLNDYSIVFWLRYGSFDALFTGDADTRVESGYLHTPLADDTLELLKVPHHGSKTGMSEEFLDWFKPKIAVISVGKNSYGHPAPPILENIQAHQSMIKRTDVDGDIRITTDGKQWDVKTIKE